MSNWAIERLADHHDRTGFDCGQPQLSRWLREDAGQYERRDLARTYVAVRPGNPLVLGYYAISTCHIRYEELPVQKTKRLPRRIVIPAALIGQLAVAQSAQGQGLGDCLLIDALRRILHLADQIGIQTVVVDAINDRARSYYLKNGFEELLDDQRRLFMPVQIIRQLKLEPLAE
jgi:ribosomal protein S18 acetylase RimI-like enzyme